MNMTIGQKIDICLIYTGISKSELARRIGTTPQNLGTRMKRGKFTNEELEQIAEAIGAKWRAEFVLQDGTVV